MTNHDIKWALRTHMPSLEWRFKRPPPGEPKGAWRTFKAKREGIEYTVSVLSRWPKGEPQTPEYSLFIDGQYVFGVMYADYLHFAARCSVEIRKLAQHHLDRSSKLQDALRRRHV